MALLDRKIPSVLVRERQTPAFVQPEAVNVTATYIISKWGSSGEKVVLDDAEELQQYFGTPIKNNATSWLGCWQYLQYARGLEVVRAVADDATNATNNGSTIRIRNQAEFENATSVSLNGISALGKYCGSLGNGLEVHVLDNANFDTHPLKGQFNTKPATSDQGKALGYVNDEVHVLVVDGTGDFGGIAGGVLERYEFLSKAGNGTNAQYPVAYFVDYINDASNYVYLNEFANSAPPQTWYKNLTGVATRAVGDVLTFTTDGNIATTPVLTATVKTIDGSGLVTELENLIGLENFSDGQTLTVTGGGGDTLVIEENSASAPAITTIAVGDNMIGRVNTTDKIVFNNIDTASYSLSAGSDGTSVSALNIMAVIDYFRSSVASEATRLIMHDCGGDAIYDVVLSHAVQMVEGRADMVVFRSPKRGDVVAQANDNVAKNNVELSERQLAISSTYVCSDDNWGLVFNKFSGKKEYIPMNSITAGLWAKTSFNEESWTSAAGASNGVANGVLELACNIDRELYDLGINSYVHNSTHGIMLFGDRTTYARPHPLRNLGNRFMIIDIKRTMFRLSFDTLFKQNNPTTRSRFKSQTDNYLSGIRARGGISNEVDKDGYLGFLTVCDETNNTALVVDNGEFYAQILIHPVGSINKVIVDVYPVANSIGFNEIVR